VTPARRTHVRRAEAAPIRDNLELVFVDYFTRDGSTLLMRLLSTSPHIAVGGPYPFERRYFAYLWRWASLLDVREWPDEWSDADLAILARPSAKRLLGPPPWGTRDLFDVDDREPISAAAFRLAWTEFVHRATVRTRLAHRAWDADVRFYAEKQMEVRALDTSGFPPHRVLATVRDPRDTFVSIQAWNAAKGANLNWATMGDEGAFIARYVTRQRNRLRWIHGLRDEASAFVIRYEQLVGNLPRVAHELGGWLGVELSAADAERDREIQHWHVTAASAASSVGRWHEELDPDIAALITRELHPELAALDYEL
jgi:Sulfotransferase family